MSRLFPIVALLLSIRCASPTTPPLSTIDMPPEQVRACQTGALLEDPPPIASYWEPGTFADDPDELIRNWYSAELCAMGEAPLEPPTEAGALRFRFLWIRSFDPPVAIRIEYDGRKAQLFAVQLESPREDYAPGRITQRASRTLSTPDWERFSEVIRRVALWNSKSEPHRCCDGAQWIFEIAEPGRYHVVDRLFANELRELGEAALELSELEVGDIY